MTTMMATAQRSELVPETPTTTVMVVEDHEEVRHMVVTMLSMNGYRVVEATNGQEAVELASSERPDAILMDLNMPVLDGLAATRRIRWQPETRDVPIVALTAHGTPDYRLKALAAGCNQFLTKPINFDQLNKTLKHLLPKTNSTEQ